MRFRFIAFSCPSLLHSLPAGKTLFCAFAVTEPFRGTGPQAPWALRSNRTMEGGLPQALSSVLTSLGRTRRLSPELDRLLLPKCVPGRNQQNA